MSTKKNATASSLVYDFLGSYGLACVLLFFLLVLTFLGTIEQRDLGLYEVQKKYFESLFLVHWIRGVFPLPLPGVYLVLILLTVNLVIGGIVRIRKSSATLGVIVIHLGILMMFAAGFVKLKFSSDGNLQLYENQQSDDYSSAYEWEIAIWNAAQQSQIKEWLIPADELADLQDPQKKRSFESKELPFKLELAHFEKNAMVLPKGPMWQAAGPTIDGFAVKALPWAQEAEQNLPAVYMTVNGSQQILWGAAIYPQVVDGGATKYAVALRRKRYRMPFTVRLDKFTHELYPNTQTPKVYKSEVTVSDGATTRPAKIEMNAPLRDRGLVLFQASWGPEGAPPGTPLFSVFAVVENPSDSWPLWSCIIIAIGMTIAFGQKLLRYINAQSVERKAAA